LDNPAGQVWGHLHIYSPPARRRGLRATATQEIASFKCQEGQVISRLGAAHAHPGGYQLVLQSQRVLLSPDTSAAESQALLFCRLETFIIITHPTEHRASRETNGASVIQQISHIMWNQNIYYFVHNSLSPVPIPSRMNPVHPFYFFNIRFNNILSSISLSFRFSNQNP